jgi:hypothetical protein
MFSASKCPRSNTLRGILCSTELGGSGGHCQNIYGKEQGMSTALGSILKLATCAEGLTT